MNIEKKLKVVGWIATSLSIIGIIFNALKMVVCWPVWLASNVFWIYWAIKKHERHQLILWIVFLVSNLFGWYMWIFIV
jgi:nicotinamide riboside transporter PnuC